MMMRLLDGNEEHAHHNSNDEALYKTKKTPLHTPQCINLLNIFPLTDLKNQPVILERPRTRAQTRAYQRQTEPHKEPSTPSSSVETTTSDESSASQFGVTEKTLRRRAQLTKKFLKRAPNLQAKELLTFLQNKRWKPSTKFSHAVTIIAELKRRSQPLKGDVNGLLRELKLEMIKTKPNRVTPIDGKSLANILTRTNDLEIATLICLTWAFAARLTSIIGLTRTDCEFHQIAPQWTSLRATFRSGKTISTTGPYSIRTQIPTIYANWILSQPMQIFRRTTEQYYAACTRALNPFTVRSIRRGALQQLAQEFEPEQLLLFSRHTRIKGLYAYLDDGANAHWELNKMTTMAQHLWTSSSTIGNRMK